MRAQHEAIGNPATLQGPSPEGLQDAIAQRSRVARNRIRRERLSVWVQAAVQNPLLAGIQGQQGLPVRVADYQPQAAGEVWNKPKASTYYRFGGAMFLDDEGHVQWAGLSEYSGGAEASAFKEKYGEAVPEAGKPTMNQWVAAKVAYDGNRKKRRSAERRLGRGAQGVSRRGAEGIPGGKI
jgi:hypothetical protein